jgi:hypothetical protein
MGATSSCTSSSEERTKNGTGHSRSTTAIALSSELMQTYGVPNNIAASKGSTTMPLPASMLALSGRLMQVVGELRA